MTAPSHASIFPGSLSDQAPRPDTGGFILFSIPPTLASLLQERGWETAAFVSSAVLKKRFGFEHGFGVYDDKLPRQGNSQEFLEDAERRAGDTVDHAIEWLNGRGAKPFFMWVHLYDPHTPYDPPSPFREQYKDRPYDGEIAYADRELGRLLESLRRKSPAEKTIVALLSDHGESLGEHGEFAHGVFLYDSTLRIAYLLSGPGVPAGLRIKPQARAVDLLPTVLDLMGGPRRRCAGRQPGAAAFSGKEAATAVSYAETLFPKINLGWAELRAIRTNRWKYIRAPKPELYDLWQDPGETSNVIQSHAAEVRKLEAELKAIVGEGRRKVKTSPMDEQTMEQLRSLGYHVGILIALIPTKGQGDRSEGSCGRF